MAWFRRDNNKTSSVQPLPDVVEPDPQAFAPIPAPAPYRPVYQGSGDLPPGRTAIEEAWPNRVGREEWIPPVRQGRYAKDTEYHRDLDTATPDGIGYTDDVYLTGVGQNLPRDIRQSGVNPSQGKRDIDFVGNQLIYKYFRHFDGQYAHRLDGSHGSIADIIPRSTPQGNYSPRTWRLTDRQDPLDSDPMDVAGSASSALTGHYTTASGVRRNFQI